jgi:uncharacterized protein YuzE
MSKIDKVSYDPESDVLMFELSSSAPIAFAREMGNVVVHFTKQNVPVLIEILNASSFVLQMQDAMDKKEEPLKGPLPAGA